MHDAQLKHLSGWPDIEGAASIVRCIKHTMTIASPLGASTVWDCHITAFPWLHGVQGHASTITGSVAEEGVTTGSERTLGGVQAWAVTTGYPIDLISTASGPDFGPKLVGQLSLDPTFDRGVGRMVGSGIEVINTTSPLNRQGLCTVYRQPQTKETTATMLYQGSGTSPTNNQAFTGQFFRAPPYKLEVANLYPGSRSWPAEEGCYCVVPFIGASNKPKSCSPFSPIITTDAAATDYNAITSRPAWVAQKGLKAGTMATPFFKSEPVHQVGAYFTGLSPETTLTVTWNVFYETFPSIDELPILVLATPSARYDPKALELLNYALATLPVGVPASFNPLGEWFWNVVDTIADIAPAIGGALGGPGGALIGAGVRKGAKALSAYNTAPSPITTKDELRVQIAKRKELNKKKNNGNKNKTLALRDQSVRPNAKRK